MTIPQDASDRDFFRSNPTRYHRVRPANASEVAWARITPADVPREFVAYAVISRDKADRWAVSVFIGRTDPAKWKRPELSAKVCFVQAVAHTGYFRPENAAR